MKKSTPQNLLRYDRQIKLAEIGKKGQEKLIDAKVLIVGAGGLGSPVCTYLAAMGVGNLGIMDDDKVELVNLHRQVLHTESDVGRFKVESASSRLNQMNSDIKIKKYPFRMNSENIRGILKGYDLAVDATDNLQSRYLLNEACVSMRKPWIYGSAIRFEGQVSVFKPPLGPCFRCVFPERPAKGVVPKCIQVGVIGVLPGIIGAIQAAETIKLIVGNGEALIGRLLLADVLNMEFRTVPIRRNPSCPLCSGKRRLNRKA